MMQRVQMVTVLGILVVVLSGTIGVTRGEGRTLSTSDGRTYLRYRGDDLVLVHVDEKGSETLLDVIANYFLVIVPPSTYTLRLPEISPDTTEVQVLLFIPKRMDFTNQIEVPEQRIPLVLKRQGNEFVPIRWGKSWETLIPQLSRLKDPSAGRNPVSRMPDGFYTLTVRTPSLVFVESKQRADKFIITYTQRPRK
ncbi:MAG: hypothetical protein NZT92_12210 [Abditibacteriales bacterium]|nr:hypothetical protein [Abditibacteriales bacterium]MDW8366733.1 hypothetical protein [Abditibacteriales bacterium]